MDTANSSITYTITFAEVDDNLWDLYCERPFTATELTKAVYVFSGFALGQGPGIYCKMDIDTSEGDKLRFSTDDSIEYLIASPSRFQRYIPPTE